MKGYKSLYVATIAAIFSVVSCNMDRLGLIMESDKVSTEFIDSLASATFTGSSAEEVLSTIDSLRSKRLLSEATSEALKADIYFNDGKYSIAEHHATKALNSGLLPRNVDGNYYTTMSVISYCKLVHGDYEGAVKYCTRAIDDAAQFNLPYAALMCRENMADAQIETGFIEEGCNNYEKALSGYRHGIDNGMKEEVHLNYLICMGCYLRQMTRLHNWDKIIQMENLALEALELMPKMKYTSEAECTSIRFVFYNCLASAYYATGDKAASDSYIKKAEILDESTRETMMLYPNIDYYLLTGNDEKVIETIGKIESIAGFNSFETNNIPFIKSITAEKVKAYVRMGELEKALQASDEAMEKVDSMFIKTIRNSSRELEIIYETGKKDKKIESLRSQLAIMIAITILSLGFAMTISTIIRLRRRISTKDKTAFKNIEEIIRYRKDKEKEPNNDESIKKEDDEDIRQKLIASKASEASEGFEVSEVREVLDKEEEVFNKIEKYIIEEKLFLNPDMTKDKLAETVGYPKYKISQLFNTYSGKSITNYLNDLRCDYAVTLLKDKRNFTIDAIAIDSGFGSKASFYRAFNERFSITPSDYKKFYFEVPERK